MAKSLSISIGKVLDEIKSNKFLLPAIQREFVWDEKQITNLFDSLMRGYPFGSLLFWKIGHEHIHDYKFYKFMRDFHERDAFRCKKAENIPENNELIAVLDGQQRLTALNIGLRGSFSAKRPHLRWGNDKAFPKKYLFLNLLSQKDEESGTEYQFAFKEETESHGDLLKNEFWLKASEIIDASEQVQQANSAQATLIKKYIPKITGLAYQQGLLGEEIEQITHQIIDSISKFDLVINQTEQITYFEEDSSDLSRVLDIFIRLNAGGTKLSYSDLLLSVAVAQWEHIDAREAINELVNELKLQYSFALTKDFVLKASLILADINNVKFDVKNFTKENTSKLESNWEIICETLKTTCRLFKSFGLSSDNLDILGILHPIAYYIKHRKLTSDYIFSAKFLEDRNQMKMWINKTLLKQGVWGSQTDTLLPKLRETIRNSGSENFPSTELEKTMASMGKSLELTAEEIEDLLELPFGKAKTFTLLSVLLPGQILPTHEVHVDHIYPKSMFASARKLEKLGFTEEEISLVQRQCNLLPNLEILSGLINEEKNAIPPLQWLYQTYPDEHQRLVYCKQQLLENVGNDPHSFISFYELRKNKMREIIKERLGQSA